MIDFIRKRHPAPGWIVIPECGNGTGYNTKRHADAIAMSIWPSHGYDIHGFELKASRGDLMKELSDPTKADAVGKYCDYWWLVVSDLKILSGVEIPPSWGILYPRAQLLRVHRKAPKHKAKVLDRNFSAAMIRRVVEDWVAKDVHEDYKKNATEVAKAELEKDRAWKRQDLQHQYDQLKSAVEAFQQYTGLTIVETVKYGHAAEFESVQVKRDYELKHIGEAVTAVMRAREKMRYWGVTKDNEDVALLRDELDGIERSIDRMEISAKNRRAAADALRSTIDEMEARAKCQTDDVSTSGDTETRTLASGIARSIL